MRPEACAAFAPHPCGSREAYRAGCRADGCRLMMVLHSKVPVANAIVRETVARIPAEPYARILRELLRAGWTFPKLATRTGFSAPALRNIALRVTNWVYPSTASVLRSLLDLLPSERVTA